MINNHIPNVTCTKLPYINHQQSCNYCRICTNRPTYECQYVCKICNKHTPAFYDRFPIQPFFKNQYEDDDENCNNFKSVYDSRF
jgi:hypothetical protein